MGRIIRLALFIGLFLTTSGYCQSNTASRHYGRGMSAFNRGDYATAILQLDIAASHGNRAPSMFFARGFSKLRTGRSDEARIDFQEGAKEEVLSGATGITQAIQRVQGPDRAILEDYRRQARANFRAKVKEIVAERKSKRQSTSLPTRRPIKRREYQPAPPVARKPAADITVSVATPDETDPFAGEFGDRLGIGEMSAVKPVAPVDDQPGDSVVEEDDPFGSDAADAFADIEDEGDPFGTFNDEPSSETDEPVFQDDAPAENTKTAGGKKKRGGLFGAAFRALTKSAVPSETASNLMKQLPVPGRPPGAPPANQTTGDDTMAEGDDDPFGFDDDSGADEEAADEEDPFGFGDDDEDVTDPFADDPS